MGYYKHLSTGKTVEFDDSHYEKIKHNGKYQQLTPKPSKKKAVKSKQTVKKVTNDIPRTD